MPNLHEQQHTRLFTLSAGLYGRTRYMLACILAGNG